MKKTLSLHIFFSLLLPLMTKGIIWACGKSSKLFSIDLFINGKLSFWREVWQPSLRPLFATSPKLVISIDYYYYFCITSCLITGNLRIEFQFWGTAWSFIAANRWQMFPPKASLVIALVEKDTIIVFALKEIEGHTISFNSSLKYYIEWNYSRNLRTWCWCSCVYNKGSF